MTEYVKIPKEEYLKLKLMTQRDYYNYTNGYQDCLNHDSKTIKDLKEWLESSKYIDVTFCLNGTTKEYRVGYNEAIEQVLERLGE